MSVDQSIKSETVNTVIIQWTQLLFNETLEEKDLLLFANKLIEKFLILAILKNTINHFKKEKQKIGKTIRNKYISTKNLQKHKYCWYSKAVKGLVLTKLFILQIKCEIFLINSLTRVGSNEKWCPKFLTILTS